MARIRVRPRLIALLGTQYSTTEDALKELVANAWDADATRVEITLPEPFSQAGVTVVDDGNGMTPADVETVYLAVADDRYSRDGAITRRGRKVRGHRGIGKFAGLAVAHRIEVATVADGTVTAFAIDRAALFAQEIDLGALDIAIHTSPATAEQEQRGTTIKLIGLNQEIAFPSVERLVSVLTREFPRSDDFRIVINSKRLTHEAVPSTPAPTQIAIAGIGSLRLDLRVVDAGTKLADPGIVFRVHGRAVGPATLLGLDRDPELPSHLVHRVTGEIDVDHLADAALPGWGGFNTSHRGYQEAEATVRDRLREVIREQAMREGGAARDRFAREHQPQLDFLPVALRDAALSAILRVFDEFFRESLDFKRQVASLILKAFASSEYARLVRRIDEAKGSEVARLSEALAEWGLFEIAAIVERTRARLDALELFDRLIADASTTELAGVHQAIERNLWLIGDTYEVFSSNSTLSRVAKMVGRQPAHPKVARLRPDLILAAAYGRHLLVELKRPSHALTWDDVIQAKRYGSLLPRYVDATWQIDIVVIGGTKDDEISIKPFDGVKVTTFNALAVEARLRLNWLIEHLTEEAPDDGGADEETVVDAPNNTASSAADGRRRNRSKDRANQM